MLKRLWFGFRCWLGSHEWISYYTAGGHLGVRCKHCDGRILVADPSFWIQVQLYGGSVPVAFTRTFLSPEEVPRAQRIPNSGCYPVYSQTFYPFSPYKGMSPSDKQAVKDSVFDGKRIIGIEKP